MEEGNYRDPGYMQGYYIGLFGRFLWHFLFAFIIQSMIIYIFDVNIFTYWILAIIFSYFINTSLPIRNTYPFFRHGLIFFCILIAQRYSIDHLLIKIYKFFMPTSLWITFIISSVIIGVIISIAKIKRSNTRTLIESFGNLSLLALIIVSFVKFGWKGGLVFIILRGLFIMIEISIAKFIYHMTDRDSNTINSSE